MRMSFKVSLFCFISLLICTLPLVIAEEGNDDAIGDLKNTSAHLMNEQSDFVQTAADEFQDDELMASMSKVRTNSSNLVDELTKDDDLHAVRSELSASGRIAVQNTTVKHVSGFVDFERAPSFDTTTFSNSSVTTDSPYQLDNKTSKLLNKDTANQRGRSLGTLPVNSSFESLASARLMNVNDFSSAFRMLLNSSNSSDITPAAGVDTEVNVNTFDETFLNSLSDLPKNTSNSGLVPDILNHTMATKTSPNGRNGVKLKNSSCRKELLCDNETLRGGENVCCDEVFCCEVYNSSNYSGNESCSSVCPDKETCCPQDMCCLKNFETQPLFLAVLTYLVAFVICIFAVALCFRVLTVFVLEPATF